jgi:hypothetical protein
MAHQYSWSLEPRHLVTSVSGCCRQSLPPNTRRKVLGSNRRLTASCWLPAARAQRRQLCQRDGAHCCSGDAWASSWDHTVMLRLTAAQSLPGTRYQSKSSCSWSCCCCHTFPRSNSAAQCLGSSVSSVREAVSDLCFHCSTAPKLCALIQTHASKLQLICFSARVIGRTLFAAGVVERVLAHLLALLAVGAAEEALGLVAHALVVLGAHRGRR